MINCALCNQEKQPKSNTHYLTDSIIRTAINEDGVNVRGKGFYFSFDPSKPFADFKFQQGTSPQKLEDMLGRKTTEAENTEAENELDFTVNDKFCKECELIFGNIEKAFNPKLLKLLRKQDLNNVAHVIFDEKESPIVRLFFLMQIWRSAVCDETFLLSDKTMELLRIKILNEDYTELEQFPISVQYLETLPSLEEGKDEKVVKTDVYKTDNIVALVEGINPNIILMNDFLIQFYEDLDFPFVDFHGFNDSQDYIELLNYNSNVYKMKVISNEDRKVFLYNIYYQYIIPKIDFYKNAFVEVYRRSTGIKPTHETIVAFMIGLGKDDDIMKLTMEGFTSYTNDFFKKL